MLHSKKTIKENSQKVSCFIFFCQSFQLLHDNQDGGISVFLLCQVTQDIK